jgi:[ribosomal protein S18]-alanine N-acetyltransferase
MKKPVDETLQGFAIQPMEVADLPEVASIAASSPLTTWTQRMFAEEMKNAFSHCFVAETHRASTCQVVGFICFRAIGQESELLNLCIHPQYRRQSAGRRLMQFYIDFSKKREIKRFYLDVDSSNEPALHLYRSFCYVPSGTRKNFYGGKTDALSMARREA